MTSHTFNQQMACAIADLDRYTRQARPTRRPIRQGDRLYLVSRQDRGGMSYGLTWAGCDSEAIIQFDANPHPARNVDQEPVSTFDITEWAKWALAASSAKPSDDTQAGRCSPTPANDEKPDALNGGRHDGRDG